MLPHVVVSLVLQCGLLVAGVRAVRQMYKARHLGGRPLLGVAANGPLLGLSVLNLAHWVFFRSLVRRVKERARSADDA